MWSTTISLLVVVIPALAMDPPMLKPKLKPGKQLTMSGNFKTGSSQPDFWRLKYLGLSFQQSGWVLAVLKHPGLITNAYLTLNNYFCVTVGYV